MEIRDGEVFGILIDRKGAHILVKDSLYDIVLQALVEDWEWLLENAEKITEVEEFVTNAQEEDCRCRDCGTTDDLTFAPCPYDLDVNNDDTPVWMCGSCRYERRQHNVRATYD